MSRVGSPSDDFGSGACAATVQALEGFGPVVGDSFLTLRAFQSRGESWKRHRSGSKSSSEGAEASTSNKDRHCRVRKRIDSPQSPDPITSSSNATVDLTPPHRSRPTSSSSDPPTFDNHSSSSNQDRKLTFLQPTQPNPVATTSNATFNSLPSCLTMPRLLWPGPFPIESQNRLRQLFPLLASMKTTLLLLETPHPTTCTLPHPNSFLSPFSRLS